jgi:hypothetical protein
VPRVSEKDRRKPEQLNLETVAPLSCFRLAGSDTLNLFPSELSILHPYLPFFDGKAIFVDSDAGIISCGKEHGEAPALELYLHEDLSTWEKVSAGIFSDQ